MAGIWTVFDEVTDDQPSPEHPRPIGVPEEDEEVLDYRDGLFHDRSVEGYW